MLNIKDLSFEYKAGNPVLSINQLSVAEGERIFLHGPSGSGKTTLLGLLAGILSAKSGSIKIGDFDLCQMSQSGKDLLRGERLGYIFQMFNLIPYLSVRENIELPCRLNPKRMNRLKGQSLEQAVESLSRHLGIQTFLDRRVTDLSVGQQQRVAAGRALIGSPDLIIADEPTSALDAHYRERFINLLFSECDLQKSTLIFVSHDRSLEKLFSRTISLGDINLVKAIHDDQELSAERLS